MTKVCPLCDSSKTITLFNLKKYTIKRCNQCLIIFNDNFPVKESASETFNEEYYEVIQSEAFKTEFIDNKLDPSFEIYTETLNILEKKLNTNNRKILDIGFGKGVFIKTSIDSNWDVEGVEISQDAYQYVKENITKNVTCGKFPELYTNEEQFRVITFWDSIEHLSNPNEYLEKAFKVLESGGILVITTDRYDSFVGYLSAFFYYVTGSLWRYPVRRVFIPYNSFYYTTSTIKRLVSDVGFTILSLKGIDYPLKKIKLNIVERLILMTLYIIGKLFNLESQVLIIAQKPEVE